MTWAEGDSRCALTGFVGGLDTGNFVLMDQSIEDQSGLRRVGTEKKKIGIFEQQRSVAFCDVINNRVIPNARVCLLGNAL